jgi:hypothetical protein
VRHTFRKQALTPRQRERFLSNAGAGYLRTLVAPAVKKTMRQISITAPKVGKKLRTVRTTVGSGTRALWSSSGLPMLDKTLAAVQEAIEKHLANAKSTPPKTAYMAATFDDRERPSSFLIVPNQRFGSHQRGPTESHGIAAQSGDHLGHGFSQATTSLGPGVHNSIMTSQSPEMNTAVQLPIEANVNALLGQSRVPIVEIHHQYCEPTIQGQLPRATHTTFIVASTNEAGKDPRLHTNFTVAQK